MKNTGELRPERKSRFRKQIRGLLPQNPLADVPVGASRQRVVADERFALIGCDDDVFIVWHDADERDGKDVHHVVYAHHIPAPDHFVAHPVDDQIDALKTRCLQKTDDTVRVADGGNLRRCDDERPIRTGNGIFKPLLDACGTV